MALDLNSLLTSFENLLSENNTTTASIDVSGSLKTRVQKFYKGVDGLHDSFPVMASLYPVVFVELMEKSEEFAQLGNSSAKRWVTIDFKVVPCTAYGLGSATEGEARENANAEIIQLTQNIEALLRSKIDLSGTVQSIKLVRTEYSSGVSESTYNCNSVIRVEAKKYTD